MLKLLSLLQNRYDATSSKNPLESKTIIIDPGHGGEDPGKSTKGLPESKIVLDTSLRLQQLLEKHTPFTVLLTRQSDNRPGHDQKVLTGTC